MKKVINWISTSFQNEMGKVCSKRTTVFALVVLDAYIVLFDLHGVNSIPALGIITPAILTILGVKDYFEKKKAEIKEK
jgi:hypothetical protein